MEIVRLKDITDKITKGTTPSNIGDDFTENGIMYFRSELIGRTKFVDKTKGLLYISPETHKKLKRSQICENDLLFSMAGIYLGKISIAGKNDVPSNTNQAVALIRLKKDVCNAEYVYYYMKQDWFNEIVCSYSAQAAQPNINLEQIGNLKIKLPNRTLQDKLVNILSAYDNLIENNNKRIRLLEQMAENLYKEWFVRFRFPGHEKAEMENGLPKGWKVASFGDLFPIKTGKKDANYSSEDGKYKFFTCSQEPLKANDYSFDCFAIILAGNGDLNAKLYRGKFEAYQRTYVLSPNDLDNIYVSYYTIRDELVHLLAGAAGAVIKFLTKGMIEKVKVTIAPPSIMNEFNTIQEKMFNLRESLIIENDLLTRQRDLLLPRLMSGKLEVKE